MSEEQTQLIDELGSQEPQQQQTQTTSEGSQIDLSKVDKSDLWNHLKSNLQEEYKNHPEFNNHKDFDQFAKTFMNQAKMIGKAKLEAPQESWTENEWNQFYGKIGRPETADAYELPDTGDVTPDKVGITEDEIKEFKTLAHELGLPKKQGAKLMQKIIEREARIQQGIAQEQLSNLESQKKILADKYGDNLAQEIGLAKDFLDSKASPELKEAFKAQGLGNNAAVIMLLNEIQKDYKNDTLKGNGGSYMSSETRAIEEFKNLKADPTFASQLSSTDFAVKKAAIEKWGAVVSAKNNALTRMKTRK